MMWLRQIAQLSTTISKITEPKSRKLEEKKGDKKSNREKSGFRFRKKIEKGNWPQAQRATAFHFLISKRLGFLEEGPAALLEASPAGTIGTSESSVAMRVFITWLCVNCAVLIFHIRVYTIQSICFLLLVRVLSVWEILLSGLGLRVVSGPYMYVGPNQNLSTLIIINFMHNNVCNSPSSPFLLTRMLNTLSEFW